MQSIVYHQTAGKGMHGYAVMIYSSKGADDIRLTAMIYQTCGLDKKVVLIGYDFFGADDVARKENS